MNQECDTCQFLQNKPLKNQILTGTYWTVGIVPDQAYLGRAIITLLSHKGSLGKLSRDEWQEFETMIPKLENAYRQAFGAEPLNIGCFMNHSYRADPPHPHVHLHVFPRYKQPYGLKGMVFEDSRYGDLYDDTARRQVESDVVEEIVRQLRAQL